MPTLTLTDVQVLYPTTPPVHALRGISTVVRSGEFVAIEGPSGGGKSTLLNVLGLLQAPTAGQYLVDEAEAGQLGDREAAQLRSSHFAFIFQSFHLLDQRPVIDSVELGLLYRGLPPRQRRSRALAALAEVGLADRWHQQAGTLSGGQRQRVAIARALASGAPVLLADEPTGNLDSENGRAVVDSLRAVHATGVTVVLVTHDSAVAAQADRRLVIRDGSCISDTEGPSPVTDRAREAVLEPACPEAVRERPARLRVRDQIRDAIATLRSRRGRTADWRSPWLSAPRWPSRPRDCRPRHRHRSPRPSTHMRTATSRSPSPPRRPRTSK